jgi:hypothetical protein
MLTADGFDDAIIGETTKELVVYNVATIIDILMERDGMTEDEAFEYFDYNIDGSYMGEQTPIFMYIRED